MIDNTQRHPRHRKFARRGSTYLLVLGTALIVSVLGMSALMIQRIQRSGFQGTADAHQARLNARTALRIGMLRLENDPDWRYNYTDGVWEADVPILGNDAGTYTLEGVDPSDSDLSDTQEDPLVLTGSGKMGAVVQKMQITLAPRNRALSCLETSMHAGNDLGVISATVTSDQIISSNTNVGGLTATVNADVEAAGEIMGSTYYGQQTSGVEPREMPDASAVFDYYINNGTQFDVSDIVPTLGPGPNLLSNPGFEDGTTSWIGMACDVQSATDQIHSGSKSLYATNRNYSWDGPAQIITFALRNGFTYEIEAWVRMQAVSDNTQISMFVKGIGAGTTLYGPPVYTPKNEWTKVTARFTPTWAGALTLAYLKVLTENGTEDFYIDDVVMNDRNTLSPPRTISRQVLSPANNLNGPTNPQGIYVIQCGGEDIHIEYSRIVGTLVLLDPGSGSSIKQAPINWQPAVPNFPALLVDGSFSIEASDSGLSEDAEITNFNPPGTEYPGVGEDTDEDDTYPSEINGLVYVSNKLNLTNQPTINGAVVGGSLIFVDGGQTTLTHNPIYLQNPPPGFSGPEQIRILLDSATKIVD